MHERRKPPPGKGYSHFALNWPAPDGPVFSSMPSPPSGCGLPLCSRRRLGGAASAPSAARSVRGSFSRLERRSRLRDRVRLRRRGADAAADAAAAGSRPLSLGGLSGWSPRLHCHSDLAAAGRAAAMGPAPCDVSGATSPAPAWDAEICAASPRSASANSSRSAPLAVDAFASKALSAVAKSDSPAGPPLASALPAARPAAAAAAPTV